MMRRAMSLAVQTPQADDAVASPRKGRFVVNLAANLGLGILVGLWLTLT